ncbi:MAG TPA: outer membrane beta-barrel protein [Cyclobacteriaceae bacterium]|nr:outer membrane beta-barrel protein [Cyclobacteriaceae bacterium]
MRIIFSFAFLLSVQTLFAQDFDRYFYVSWNYNTPLSDTNWIGNSSATGLKLGYRKIITDRISAGVDFTWSYYDQYEPPTTFVSESGAIHTDYFKYIYNYGITVNGQYFLPVNNTNILPFVGLGLGAAYNRYTLYYNIYTDDDTSWGFLARPEVGVLFTFSKKVGAIVGAHYDYSTAKSDYFELSNFSNFGFNVGLVFTSY